MRIDPYLQKVAELQYYRRYRYIQALLEKDPAQRLGCDAATGGVRVLRSNEYPPAYLRRKLRGCYDTANCLVYLYDTAYELIART